MNTLCTFVFGVAALQHRMRPPAVLTRLQALMLGKNGAFVVAMAGDQRWFMPRWGIDSHVFLGDGQHMQIEFDGTHALMPVERNKLQIEGIS